jgi:peptidyl-prolyl cis-trans isomerase C
VPQRRRKGRNDFGAIALSSSILVLGCSSSGERSVIARVDGESIRVEEFRSRMREYQLSGSRPLGATEEAMELKKQILNELIEEKVMLTEADRRKLEVTPVELDQALKDVTRDYPNGTFEEALKAKPMSMARWRERMRLKILLEKVITDITKGSPAPTEETVSSYYQTHTEEFHKSEQIHLQQIVVRTAEDGAKILDELKRGQPFETLAQTYSFTPEAAQGGDLGFVAKGIMPNAIEDAVAKLPVRKPSAVIASEYGFHVVQVLERKPARQLTLDEARPEIVRILTQVDREKRLANWREGVLSRAKIERNHALLAQIH